MANTEAYQLDAFNTKLAQWVRIGSFTGVSLSTARDIYRSHAGDSNGHVRLILLDAPEGANVVYGSASENPVQAAKDSAQSE